MKRNDFYKEENALSVEDLLTRGLIPFLFPGFDRFFFLSRKLFLVLFLLLYLRHYQLKTLGNAHLTKHPEDLLPLVIEIYSLALEDEQQGDTINSENERDEYTSLIQKAMQKLSAAEVDLLLTPAYELGAAEFGLELAGEEKAVRVFSAPGGEGPGIEFFVFPIGKEQEGEFVGAAEALKALDEVSRITYLNFNTEKGSLTYHKLPTVETIPLISLLQNYSQETSNFEGEEIYLAVNRNFSYTGGVGMLEDNISIWGGNQLISIRAPKNYDLQQGVDHKLSSSYWLTVSRLNSDNRYEVISQLPLEYTTGNLIYEQIIALYEESR